MESDGLRCGRMELVDGVKMNENRIWPGGLDTPIIFSVAEHFVLRFWRQRCSSIGSNWVQSVHVDRIVDVSHVNINAEVVALKEVEPVAVTGGRLILYVRGLTLCCQAR